MDTAVRTLIIISTACVLGPEVSLTDRPGSNTQHQAAVALRSTTSTLVSSEGVNIPENVSSGYYRKQTSKSATTSYVTGKPYWNSTSFVSPSIDSVHSRTNNSIFPSANLKGSTESVQSPLDSFFTNAKSTTSLGSAVSSSPFQMSRSINTHHEITVSAITPSDTEALSLHILPSSIAAYSISPAVPKVSTVASSTEAIALPISPSTHGTSILIFKTETRTVSPKAPQQGPTKHPGFWEQSVVWWCICVLLSVIMFTAATLIYFRDSWMTFDLRGSYMRIKRNYRRRIRETARRVVTRANTPPIAKSVFLEEYNIRKSKGQLEIEHEIIQMRLGRLEKKSTSTADTSASSDTTSLSMCGTNTFSQKRDVRRGNIRGVFIDGYNTKEKFLPITEVKATTHRDFWKTVWDCNIQAIVLLRDCSYMGEAITYWPEFVRETRFFGDLRITLQSKTLYADYQVRRLRLMKEGSLENRDILHFRLLDLDVDGKNLRTLELLNFMKLVKVTCSDVTAPFIIHGSPSLSAIYVACEISLKQLEIKKNVSIFFTVMTMLVNVPEEILVLNKDDYLDVYRLIAIYSRCGNTTCRPDQVVGVCTQLSQKNRRTGRTGFQQELQYIRDFVLPLTSGQCAGGFRDENRDKNREPTLLPPDSARPYLKLLEKNTSTDYINAIYAQDFRQRNAFIVTEWPMKSTVNDLWRMVYDEDISAIVVLDKFENMSDRGYPKFWPDDIMNAVNYGALDVGLVSCKREPHYQARVFSVQKKRHFTETRWRKSAYFKRFQNIDKSFARQAKRVTMYHFEGWEDLHHDPTSMSALLQLACIVYLTRQEQHRPVCAMSKDGFKKCGVLCATVIMHDQLTSENEVDIFNAVKSVKLNRPELVPTSKEYSLCYDIALAMSQEYLKSGPAGTRTVHEDLPPNARTNGH